MHFTADQLHPYLSFRFSRSGGKGGQHVNKVSSRAELNFDLHASPVFSPEQKGRILAALSNRLTADGQIQVVSDEDRSQLANKEHAVKRLMNLLTGALHEPKRRKATKVPKGVKERRLEDKRRRAMRKIDRRL